MFHRFFYLTSVALLMLAFHLTSAQEFDYICPLEVTPLLAGNYGELRPNHFHAGVDIKTGGREGLNVLAVADGHVSRIKISPWGYGKVIYIDHPEGYTTVYGHLKSLSPNIEAYVRKQQYVQKSFEVDVFPGSEDLVVKRGEVIALSGNTGGSGGPHLHFEIRHTETEIPLNPLVLKFPVGDSKAPELQSIGIAPLNEGSSVAGRNTTLHGRVSSGRLTVEQPVAVSGAFGVEVAGYDSQDGSVNRNGIYMIKLFVDDKLVSTFKADSIPFNLSGHLNALIDYEYYYQSKSRFLRLYRLPGNHLPNLNYKNGGILQLDPGEHRIRIEATDVAGNKSSCAFDVLCEQNKEESSSTEVIAWDEPYLFESDQARLYFPSGCFFDDVPLNIKELERSTPTIEVLKSTIPLEQPFTIELKGKAAQGDDWLICQMSASGRVLRALPTKRDGQWFRAESKYLGTFALIQDTEPPVIDNINITSGRSWPRDGRMVVKVKDNLSGIYRYSAEASGEWVLMEYEPKDDMLFINVEELPEHVEEQILRITVTDLAGNEAELERFFFKKPFTEDEK